MVRYSQSGRRPNGPPTLPNDLPNSSRSSSNVASAAAGLADTTRSRFSDVPEMHEWNTSLSLLRTAFLVTALPTLRETESPLELGRVGQTHSLATGQRSDCQTLAAPAPTVSDDPASAHRSHAFAEAVRLGPLTTIRLISTLHPTPLQALRSIRSTDESISEACNTIQQSPRRVLPCEGDTSRSLHQKNAAKRRLRYVRAPDRPSPHKG